MNTGIYALYWWEQDLVYIGLSQDLKDRKREHLSKLNKQKHTNYKVQSAFNMYGSPDFIVLEYCNISALANREIYWTNEFDALNTGLCIVEPGIVGFGANSNASKYSKIQILRVFRKLYTSNLTYKEISDITGVSRATITDLCNGKSHLWLKEKYPYQYKLMVKNTLKSENKSLRKEIAILVSPNGELFEVPNIRDFAIKYNLINTCLGEVIRGKRKTHKGWTLANS